MFLTQKNAIRGLSVREFNSLRHVCPFSKKTFNVRLNPVRLRLWVELSPFTGCLTRRSRAGNNWVRGDLNKIARSIIYYCLSQQLGKLIIGCNPAWKQENNLSKQNKFQFVQIPHYVLWFKLKALCKRYGILYREQEERCLSSSASSLNSDEQPMYKADNLQEYKLSGRLFVAGSTNLKIAASFIRIATVQPIYSKKVTTIWIPKDWLGDFFSGVGHDRVQNTL